MQRIVSLLQKTIGLDATVVGDSVQQAIRQRMQKNGVQDEHGFLELLQNSPCEMTALIESVAVPETWFFRYREAFQLMQEHLSPMLTDHRVPRLLSIPCSTGEEPYSMAMTLLDMGFPAGGFHIDAVDLSRQHLDRAEQAVYRQSSFRGAHLDFRQRYFRQTAAGYVLSSGVRECVNFHQGNILNHKQLEGMGYYDVIYCRNILIYLDEEHRKRTVILLAKMLRDDGLLFVGHAETGLIWKNLFHSVTAPMAFAYRRNTTTVTSSASPTAVLPPVTASRKPVIQKEHLIAKKNRSSISVPELPQPVSDVEAETGPSLQEASRLADQGKLDEARQQCEACLQQQGASADVWFLLGLISDIQGQHQDAETAFRKTLYLEPEHQEALMHLAFLLDKRGNQRAAQHLRDRVQRIHGRQQAGVGK